MKKTLGCLGTAIECLLFLWLLVGLWACAVKIKELEGWQEEYIAANSHVETSDNKLLLVAMRCQKMEQDNDILRLRIEDLEETLAADTNAPPPKATPGAPEVRPVAIDDLVETEQPLQ
jgi:hypothetical protein